MKQIVKSIRIRFAVYFTLFAIGTALGGGMLRGIGLCAWFYFLPYVK